MMSEHDENMAEILSRMVASGKPLASFAAFVDSDGDVSLCATGDVMLVLTLLRVGALKIYAESESEDGDGHKTKPN